MPRTLLQRIAAPAARNDSILGLSIVRWDISLALNMTFFLFVFASRRRNNADDRR